MSRALTIGVAGFDSSSLAVPRVNTVTRGGAAPESNASRTYSVSESQDALNKAVAGAQDILDALSSIRDQIKASDGLETRPTYYADGRRGVQSEIQRLSAKINELAAGSGSSDINLIGNPSTIYQLRTTSLGGTVSVVSQPLDSASLGIDTLDVSTQSGTEAAIQAINTAIQTATGRYRLLADAAAELPSASNFRDRASSPLTAFSSDGFISGGTSSRPYGSSSVGRGALVNISA
ncbi:MAG: hypothetical protein K2X44_11440 [Magnetospirillum sp.]|nr:hypothetical protein [Magnetospirillum sp.]